MIVKFMNSWKYEKDLYLMPCIRLNFSEGRFHFFVAFLTVCAYNLYNDETKDHLQEHYDQF